jgi:4-hydroxybenzoate polyprenyltransferase
MNNPDFEHNVPLCVSCDRALFRTDIFHEAIFASVLRNPLWLFVIPFWLLRGRAAVLARISNSVRINWRTLPLVEPVVERIRSARAQNRPVVLLTSMPKSWADEVAADLDLSTIMLPSTHASDVPSELTKLYGPHGYDYIGHGEGDLLIFESARHGLIVTSNRSAIVRARERANIEAVIPRERPRFAAYLKLIRVHQWVKNCLIWVPLLAAHRLTSLAGVEEALVAFLAFSFCASSVYVLNDLVDLEADRQHFRKKRRPVAAGRISVENAVAVGLVLLVAAAILSFRVSTYFAAIVGTYFSMTLAYSLRLKRQVIVDVMLLAALYTIRVVAGAIATQVVPSFWLLAFSMFLFLSLAVVKRYSEMLITLSQDKQYAAGRGYSVQDMPVILSLGIGAGIAAIVVLALYINDPLTSKLYPATLWLWPIPPLMLYWISRVWMKAHRGEMHDDPVVFAMRDWQSLVILLLGGVCFALAAAR